MRKKSLGSRGRDHYQVLAREQRQRERWLQNWLERSGQNGSVVMENCRGGGWVKELTALASWLVLSTWFMISDSFMSVTGLWSFFKSALYFTCREERTNNIRLLKTPVILNALMTYRRSLLKKCDTFDFPRGQPEANIPHWPCCEHPSWSCRF